MTQVQPITRVSNRLKNSCESPACAAPDNAERRTPLQSFEDVVSHNTAEEFYANGA